MYQLYQKDQDQIRDATYISDVVFLEQSIKAGYIIIMLSRWYMQCKKIMLQTVQTKKIGIPGWGTNLKANWLFWHWWIIYNS